MNNYQPFIHTIEGFASEWRWRISTISPTTSKFQKFYGQSPRRVHAPGICRPQNEPSLGSVLNQKREFVKKIILKFIWMSVDKYVKWIYIEHCKNIKHCTILSNHDHSRKNKALSGNDWKQCQKIFSFILYEVRGKGAWWCFLCSARFCGLLLYMRGLDEVMVLQILNVELSTITDGVNHGGKMLLPS